MQNLKNIGGRDMSSNKLKVGIVSAALGSLIKLSNIAENFPQPLNFIGEVIIFAAVIIIVFDVVRR